MTGTFGFFGVNLATKRLGSSADVSAWMVRNAMSTACTFCFQALGSAGASSSVRSFIRSNVSHHGAAPQGINGPDGDYSLIVNGLATRKAGALAGLEVLAIPGSGDADAAVLAIDDYYTVGEQDRRPGFGVCSAVAPHRAVLRAPVHQLQPAFRRVWEGRRNRRPLAGRLVDHQLSLAVGKVVRPGHGAGARRVGRFPRVLLPLMAKEQRNVAALLVFGVFPACRDQAHLAVGNEAGLEGHRALLSRPYITQTPERSKRSAPEIPEIEWPGDFEPVACCELMRTLTERTITRPSSSYAHTCSRRQLDLSSGLSISKESLPTHLLSQPTRAMYVAALKGGQEKMVRTFNPQVEAVISESTQPELVRELIAALDEGQLSEEKQRHAMALLQLYDVDLFDLGLAFLSDKTQEELEQLAEQAEE